MKLELRRKRDLGRILDDSFALYRAHLGTLLLISAVVVVPVYLLVYGVGLGWLWSGYETTSVSATEIELGDAAEQLAGLAAQLLVVTPLVTAMTVHLVRAAGEERRATARETISAGLDVFPKLLLAITLVGIGVFGGLLLLIVPGLILAIRWVVVSQVVMLEGAGGSAALRRSFDLTRGRFWPSLLVLFVLLLLTGILSAVILAPLEYAGEQADTMALSLLGQILGSVVTLPLLAVGYTLLYYSLLADKEGAGPPAPAAALEPGSPSLPGAGGGDERFGDGWAPPRPPA